MSGKKLQSKLWLTLLMTLSLSGVMTGAWAQYYMSPANGIHLLQMGEVLPSEEAEETIYFTLYSGSNRVNSIDYYYNGNGFLNLTNRQVIANTGGADGIVHHWDGDILVAGQGNQIHKVNEQTGAFTSVSDVNYQSQNYHLMTDPDGVTLWSADIPGDLYKFPIDESQPNHMGQGEKVAIIGDENEITNLAWLEDGTIVYTRSHWNGTQRANDPNKGVATFGRCWWTSANRDTLVTERLLVQHGFHGMHYDDYSKTILTFGEQHIVQIDPISLTKIAELDFADFAQYGFPADKIRFDQGTTDAKGHIFVASNFGYMVFVDFTSNALKRIDNNILIHMQWIDNDLDDVAPLSGHGSGNDHVLLSSGSGWSSSGISSSQIFVSSSSGPIVFSSSSEDPGISSGGTSDPGTSSDASSGGTSDPGTSSDGSSGGTSDPGTSSDGSSGGTSDPGTSSDGSSGGTSDPGTSSDGSSGGTSDPGTSSDGSSGGSSDPGTSSDGSSGGTSDPGTSSDGSSGGTSDPGTSSSSDGTGTSNGSMPGGSSSSDGTGTSNGSMPGGSSSSDGTGTSTGSMPGGSSSSDGTGTSTGSMPGGSSSSDGTGTSTGSMPGGSSSSDNSGAIWGNLSSSYDYTGDGTIVVEGELPDQSGWYPEDERIDEAQDSLVESGTILTPVAPGQTPSGDTVIISGNVYEKVPTTGGTPVEGLQPGEDNGKVDSIPLGAVIEMEVDPDVLKDYFGLNTGDTIKVVGSPGIDVINPNDPSQPGDTIAFVLGDDNMPVWITGDEPTDAGKIFFVHPETGENLPFGNFMTYDPIPDLEISIIKDVDGDNTKDLIEVFLDSTLPESVTPDSMQVVFGDTLISLGDATLGGINNDRISASVENTILENPVEIDSNDKVIVYFTDDNGVRYQREIKLIDLYAPVLENAVLLKGFGEGASDSLFLDMHVPLTEEDLQKYEDFFVLLNNGDVHPDVARLIAMDKMIFESETGFEVLGDGTDSLSLYPGLSLVNLPYIVQEEFTRRIPVTVIERTPGVAESGYYDSDGDGVMDSVSFTFNGPIDSASLEWFEFVIPWYTESNKIVYLNPKPEDLIIDPNDPTKVSWKVKTSQPLKHNLTSVPPQLPDAKLNIYYPIPDQTVVERRTLDMGDKMAPALVSGKLLYADKDSRYDTLRVAFTEAVVVKNADGDVEFFKYYHSDGDTLTLKLRDIVWSEDGMYGDIIIRAGDPNGLFPGDSLFLSCLACGSDDGKAYLTDEHDNIITENAAPIMVEGSLTHLVETINVGGFDPNDPTLQDSNSVTVQYVPAFTRAADLKREGEMGHLIELGGRFMPQLLHQIAANRGISNEDQKAAFEDSLRSNISPEDVYIAVQAYYFDYTGQYVTDLTTTIPCNSDQFEGNCLSSDKKLFLKWNYKSKDKRFVGSGVYLVNFKVLIQYDRTKIEENMQEKWGIIRGKGYHTH